MKLPTFFGGRSLLASFLLSFLAVILLTILVVSLATSLLFANYYYAAKEQELAGKGRQIVTLIESYGIDQDGLPVLPLSSLASFANAQILLVDREGLVRAAAPNPAGGPWRRDNAWPNSRILFQLDPAETDRILSGKVLTGRGYDARFERAVVSATVPFHATNGQIAGALLLYTSVSDLEATVTTVRRISLYAGGFSALLAVLLAYYLSRSLSRPLKQISDASLAMVGGDYTQRVTATGPAEVKQLAANINDLAAGLDRSINALAQEKEKLAGVLAHMSEGVAAIDKQGRVILSNASARRILGGHAEEGSPLGQSDPTLNSILNTVLTAAGTAAAELQTPAGQGFVRVTAAPLLEQDGAPSGAVVVIQDVTEQHHLEQMRRDFVANVSHELRTPLTSLQGVLEAIQDGMLADPAERERYVSLAHSETLRLKRLINDLLDLSRLDAGRVHWEINAIDLADLAHRVVTHLHPQAEKRGITIEVEASDDLPPALGNEDRTAQVLTNLLENAIRVSPSGKRVAVSISSEEDHLLVQVADQGPGVPVEDMPYIWERFYRVEKSRARDTGGTGLGLAIARQIVEAQGGKVSVTSPPGNGAVFSFTIPVAPEEYVN